LRIGGWPDEQAQQTRFAVEVPGALSWMAYGNTEAVVRGLEDFPKDDWPPVLVVHLAFQVMVAIGFALMLVSAWSGWSLLRRSRLPNSRAFLWSLVASGPLAVVALQAGWIVTEVGRQPWIVQGVMRTAEAVTHVPVIPWVFAVTVAIYSMLTIGVVLVLRLLARVPLAKEAGHGS
jgi:cytochrome d ubiquinol oxidase subunit I